MGRSLVAHGLNVKWRLIRPTCFAIIWMNMPGSRRHVQTVQRALPSLRLRRSTQLIDKRAIRHTEYESRPIVCPLHANNCNSPTKLWTNRSYLVGGLKIVHSLSRASASTLAPPVPRLKSPPPPVVCPMDNCQWKVLRPWDSDLCST